jgi:vitamin B12 transporter
MNRSALALAILVALAPARLVAKNPQDKAVPIPKHDIVVTATRLETPEKKVGSSVTVITADELVRTGRTFVLDALEAALGLSVLRNGGPGSSASVFIRGAASEHTLVLLDGVELNDPVNPARSFDLAHLSLSQVDRIEVLRGPQGLLYGSDALGGVINIITRTGPGRPRLALASSADTLGSLAADVALSGSGGRTDYSLALFHERTAGVSAASPVYAGNVEKDGYRNLSLDARIGFTPRPSSRLSLSVRGAAARTELDNFGGPGGDDPNNRQDYGTFQVRLHGRDLSPGGRWERTLSLSWTGARREYDNPFDDLHPEDSDESLYKSDLWKLDWQNNFFLRPGHTLTAGLELEEERGASRYASESAYGPYESVFPSARAGTAGLYVLDHWEVCDRLFVTAGVRAETHTRSGAAVTFRVAPSFVVPGTGTRLKASLGTGFKSPSLYQLFAPASSWGPVGNPGLRPERVTGFDAGVEQRFAAGRLVLGLTWFRNGFRDLIDFDYAAGYVNIGRARTSGLEALAEARPAEGVRLSASYTRLSARDLDARTDLLRRPKDRFSASAQARLFRRIDLALSGLWVGRRPDTDFSAYPYSTVLLERYVLLDASLVASLGSGLELFVRLANALDERYEPVWGYGAPGRSLRTGIRFAR